MRYLLDTHALLWAEKQPEQLPKRVREILDDPASQLSMSVASLWEMTIKSASGKLTLPGRSLQATIGLLSDLRIELLPITPEHLLVLEQLPAHHRDPFDRIMVAQAMAEQLTLLTADRTLRTYKVEQLWR